ncbi:response regulator [Shewanella inventionis]|uniref:Response regulator n=1 Tax=Shewanella inventionis TaxID=1738770 RepID=A0ABQ1ISM0_9GAMM|nr:response regulator [Shewanella inventionis]MCL1157688.1 response regulator [Shewanella inventionis]GGB48377.1 response regulator [Shewanella inventionis]
MALTDVKILVVEDDPIFRQVVVDFLQGQGACVQQACDGPEGITLFSQTTFDIVIADLGLPILGGLPMLRQMQSINPAIPSIVISGNDIMSDVVEALRIGASDYLTKPIADLFIIEQAVVQAILTATTTMNAAGQSHLHEMNELSYQELTDNLYLLEQNAQAAKSVQQQLFPASHVHYPKAAIDYSLFKNNDVSAYFIDSTMVGDNHLVMYMAHFDPEDNSAAFGCVLLRSFVNQKLKLFRNGLSTTLIEPGNMLTYLHKRMVRSGLHILTDIIYVSIDLHQHIVSVGQAGNGLRCYLRQDNHLMPLVLPHALQLGDINWHQAGLQRRTLLMGEKLCIGTYHQQHKQQLLNNRFTGLIYQPDIHAGGFMQLSCG